MSDAPLAAAAAALAGGRSVRVGPLTVASVETATGHAGDLLLSAGRAAALGLGNRKELVPGKAVQVTRCDWIDEGLARAIADPGQDFERFVPGPLQTVAPEHPDAARAALELARIAGVLPALWIVENEEETSAIDPDAILGPAEVSIAARARLPVEELGEAQIVVFREKGNGEEHVALLFGSWGGNAPLARLHSECLTGDVFASLKCDCGPQLKAALALLDANPDGGILLYLRQEGRGIGLANKIRAYALQDRGLDTVEANRRLGFADDERDYRIAAAMLAALKVSEVRLLTNNPAKVAGLEQAGIKVAQRVAHHMPANPHNADYLATKRKKSGHLD